MPTLKVSLGIGYANARQSDEIEIDGEEWGACDSDEARENLIDRYAQEWAWDHIDLAAEVVDDEI
jgi:hypothetical protein